MRSAVPRKLDVRIAEAAVVRMRVVSLPMRVKYEHRFKAGNLGRKRKY